MSLLFTWVCYALLATALFSGFFLWAVRAGQFADQDRARYLPLLAGTPDEKHESEGRPWSR